MRPATATGRWPALLGEVQSASAGLRAASARCTARLDEREPEVQQLAAELRALRRASDPAPASVDSRPDGPWRVLLVAPEGPVARAARHALEEAGAAVRTATTGPQACALLAEAPDALVVAPLLGPGCTGLSVAREARLRCPGARVVLWPEADAAEWHEVRVDAVVPQGAGLAALVREVVP